MKDIIMVTEVKDIIDKAQVIASFFRGSPHQFFLLREIQKDMYRGKHYSFTLSVVTQWGTQYGLLKSILQVKDAL